MDVYERQDEPLRVVYGRKRVQGAFRAYRKVQTSDNRNLVVYRLCWGPIQGVSNIKIDGVTLANLGLVAGTDYNVYTTGSPAADPIMAARDASWATVAHPSDCAHLVVLFKKPTDQIPAVDVRAIECVIDGMLVYDKAADPTLTTRYYRSSNPRLATADFETDNRYGCGFPTSIVYGEPNFQEAVDDCDLDLGGGRKRYTWGLELNETMEADQALEMMRGHAALQWAYNDGYRKWWVDQDRPNSGITFANGAGTVGNIKGVSPLQYKGTSEFPTRVIVWFTNEAADWKRDFAADDHPLLASGGVELVEWTFEYTGILTYDQAKRIAKWLRAVHTIPKNGTVRVNAEGLQVLPGSRITLSNVVEWNITTPEDWSITDCSPSVDRSTWDLIVEPYTSVWDDTLQTQTDTPPPTNPTPFDLLGATTSAQLVNMRSGSMGAIGGSLIIAPTARLSANLAAGATSMLVDTAAFVSGDRVMLRKIVGTTPQFEAIAVTSGASGSGPYTYSITRNLDGSGANDWVTNDVIVGTGQTGSAFIDAYNVSSMKSTSEVGPAIAFNIRNSSTWNDWSPRAAIGNLNGVFGYIVDTYGAAFGNPSGAWLKIDPTNGVRIGYNTTTLVEIDAAGNASFSGEINADAGTIGGLTISAGGVSGSNFTFGPSGISISSGSFTIGGFTVTPSGNVGITGNISAASAACSVQSLTATNDVTSGNGLIGVWADLTSRVEINGTKVLGAQGAAIADVSSANATDLASVIALANELKSKFNTSLSRDRTHGLIAT